MCLGRIYASQLSNYLCMLSQYSNITTYADSMYSGIADLFVKRLGSCRKPY